MAKHNITGLKGEDLAVRWLTDKGFRILERNWRSGHLEVDAIAVKNSKLHFFEVKCRRSGKFGYPETSISKTKLKNLMNAAEAYCNRHPGYKKVQFDVLSIFIFNEEATYFLIEDVYLVEPRR